MPIVSRLIAQLGVDGGDFERKLTDAERRMQRAARSMRDTGRDLTTGVSVPLAAAAGASIAFAANFERQMNRAVAMAGVSTTEIRKLRAATLDLAGDTGRAPEELGNALFFIASAGQRGAEAMETLRMSARGAAMGMGETRDVANAITSAMEAYKAQGLSASQALDTLVAASREGKMATEEFAASIGTVLTVSSKMGVQFADVAGAAAVLSRTGVESAQAMTYIRGALQAILKPAADTREQLHEMGLTVEQVRDLMQRDLLGTLDELYDRVGQNEEAFARIFPNVEGLVGALALVGDESGEVAGVMERVANSTGAADDAWRKSQGTALDMDRALASIKASAIELGDAFAPIAREIANDVRELADWFSGLDNEQKNLAKNLLLAGIGLGPALQLVGAAMDFIIVRRLAMVGTLTATGTAAAISGAQAAGAATAWGSLGLAIGRTMGALSAWGAAGGLGAMLSFGGPQVAALLAMAPSATGGANRFAGGTDTAYGNALNRYRKQLKDGPEAKAQAVVEMSRALDAALRVMEQAPGKGEPAMGPSYWLKLFKDLGMTVTSDFLARAKKVGIDPRVLGGIPGTPSLSGPVGQVSRGLDGGFAPMRVTPDMLGGSGVSGAAPARKPVSPHEGLARAAARAYGLDEGWFLSMIEAESAWNPRARSHAGAMGLGQLMPGTARGLGVRNPWDPEQNLMGAARYLAEQLKRFGSYELALAAYNAGPGNKAVRAGRIPQNGETEHYVARIQRLKRSGKYDDAGAGLDMALAEALADQADTQREIARLEEERLAPQRELMASFERQNEELAKSLVGYERMTEVQRLEYQVAMGRLDVTSEEYGALRDMAIEVDRRRMALQETEGLIRKEAERAEWLADIDERRADLARRRADAVTDAIGALDAELAGQRDLTHQERLRLALAEDGIDMDRPPADQAERIADAKRRAMEADWSAFEAGMRLARLERERLQAAQEQVRIDEEAARAIERREAELDRWQDAYSAHIERIKPLAEGFAETFVGSLDRIKEDGFQGFFTSFVQGFESMLAEAARQWLTSLIYQQLMGLFPGPQMPAPDAALSAPVVGVTTGPSGVVPMAGARALGGPVFQGRAYLVGERGPEIFVPGQSGHVDSRGGQAINVTINVPPGSSPEQWRANQGAMARDVARALNRAAMRNR